MLRSQLNCERCSFNPETWVYVEDAPMAAELLRDSSYQQLDAIPEAAKRVIRKPPACWLTFLPQIPKVYQPDFTLGPINAGTTLLFLHSRVSATGKKRLVVVGLEVPKEGHAGTGHNSRIAIISHVIREGTWSESPLAEDGNGQLIGQGHGEEGGPDTWGAGELRFGAGQPDANNPARFTIPWEFQGVRHTIVGELEEGKYYEDWTIHVNFKGLP
jgi:hypothetical protein